MKKVKYLILILLISCGSETQEETKLLGARQCAESSENGHYDIKLYRFTSGPDFMHCQSKYKEKSVDGYTTQGCFSTDINDSSLKVHFKFDSVKVTRNQDVIAQPKLLEIPTCVEMELSPSEAEDVIMRRSKYICDRIQCT
ncbi:hypothetical protein [Pseudobacteriovorax antillogorgiicola]|uniref:Uncharacterized protein n=1 Tax=Pseudobacteriovorax antillogorgiicola TaxID=1513793 RepID=A0A1Y6BGF1_9BACT|nr:hypothetical protein [Pseudobacteriovorax antillogorgiicola]TCS56369.1 hypothetical protein EDD56_104191 [Pseudobacteriovorax antillogorgiicola]SMF06611.1 hypothetical protein SAMN06296036_104142 [Pseudobacteriovorax antillogorgiicola]